MPMPVPEAGEAKDKFIERFMGDKVMVDDYTSPSQRYAIAQSQWERHLSKMALDEIMPKTLAKAPDEEIISLHHRTHQWYANAVREGHTVEPIEHAHEWIVQELQRRGLNHDSPMPKSPARKSLILVPIFKSHSRAHCMECDAPPTKEFLWAEGMAHAWLCDEHMAERARRNADKSDEQYDDICSVRDLKWNVASDGWKDGPPTKEQADEYIRNMRKAYTFLTPSGRKGDARQSDQGFTYSGAAPKESFIMVPDYISLVGSAIKNMKTAHDMDFVIRDTEDSPTYWKENIYLAIRKIFDPDKQGKDIHLIFNPQGPHEGNYLPLYDLVLRAEMPEIKSEVSKAASAMPGWKTFVKDAPQGGKLVDIGPGDSKPEGYTGLGYGDQADIKHNLDECPWPIESSSVSVLRANHVLEHLENPVAIMKEIYRVLKPGGKAIITVPSTDGEGAFAHPEHKSYWNKASFMFWTDPRYAATIDGNKENPALFDLDYLQDRKNGAAIYTDAVLTKPTKDTIDGTFDPSRDFRQGWGEEGGGNLEIHKSDEPIDMSGIFKDLTPNKNKKPGLDSPEDVPFGLDSVTTSIKKWALQPVASFIAPHPAQRGRGQTDAYALNEIWDWVQKRLDKKIQVTAEPKWNGFRSIIQKAGRKVSIKFEGGGEKYPILVNADPGLRKLEDLPDFIIDCNLGILYKGNRIAPRPDLMTLDSDKPHVPEGGRIQVTAFDILYWKDASVNESPFTERRKVLEDAAGTLRKADVDITKSQSIKSKGDLAKAWTSKTFGSAPLMEGLVIKDGTWKYEPGPSTDGMIKIKHTLEVKARIIEKKVAANGKTAYRGGLEPGEMKDEIKNLKEYDGKQYVDMGFSFNSDLKAAEGKTMTFQVDEVIYNEPNGRLSWLGAVPLDVDPTRGPYAAAQVIDMAYRSNTLQHTVEKDIVPGPMTISDIPAPTIEYPKRSKNNDIAAIFKEPWPPDNMTNKAFNRDNRSAFYFGKPTTDEAQGSGSRQHPKVSGGMEIDLVGNSAKKNYTPSPDEMYPDTHNVGQTGDQSDFGKPRKERDATGRHVAAPAGTWPTLDEVQKVNPNVEGQARDESGQWSGSGGSKGIRPFRATEFDNAMGEWKSYTADHRDELERRGATGRANMANAMMLGMGADLNESRPGDRSFRITSDRGTEGAIFVSRAGEKDNEAHISWLASAPWNQEGMPDRTPGTASALLADTFEWAKDNNVNTITLDSSINAMDYYRHVGFRNTGESSISMSIDRDRMDGYLGKYRSAHKDESADKWYNQLVKLEDNGIDLVQPKAAMYFAKVADEGGHGETHGEAADASWKKNWQDQMPHSGKGKFVYQHHWPAVSDEEVKLDDHELMEQTEHAAHGDIRFEGDDVLWGWAVFIGKMEDNKDLPHHDKLIDWGEKGTAKLQVKPKLPQPKDWLKIGVGKPYTAGPGEAGTIGENNSKLFALDHGTYRLGVARAHMQEVFLDGSLLKGRYVFQYAPLGGGSRTWLLDKPEDQKPYAETHSLDETIKDIKSKGQRYLVWSDGKSTPRFLDTEHMRTQKQDIEVPRDSAATFAKEADLSGAMLAIPVPVQVADRIAIEGGEPPERMHITLAYIGPDVELAPRDRQKIVNIAYQLAQSESPIDVSLDNTGWFLNHDEAVYYAKVESPELEDFRQTLVAALDQNGVEYSKDHANYTPHVTLKYIKKGEQLPKTMPIKERFMAGALEATFSQKAYPIAFGLQPNKESVTKTYYAQIVKAATEKRFTFGVVYKASEHLGKPETDAHNEFATADELQEALWDYVKSGDRKIYIQHGSIKSLGYKDAGEWVEIVAWPLQVKCDLHLPNASVKETIIPANSIWMGVLWSPWAWDLVKAGKIRGYSFGGMAGRVNMD